MSDDIVTIKGKKLHERFNRKVWAFKSDFTGALAKWLVKQSPYVVPYNLSICIEKFDKELDKVFEFDCNDMVEISLTSLTKKINSVLESIPEAMELNSRKNGRDGYGFSSRYSEKIDPDDDFICIMAVAQNITCEFAEREDAQCWLERNKDQLQAENKALTEQVEVLLYSIQRICMIGPLDTCSKAQECIECWKEYSLEQAKQQLANKEEGGSHE